MGWDGRYDGWNDIPIDLGWSKSMDESIKVKGGDEGDGGRDRVDGGGDGQVDSQMVDVHMGSLEP